MYLCIYRRVCVCLAITYLSRLGLSSALSSFMNEGCRLKRRRKWRPRILQEFFCSSSSCLSVCVVVSVVVSDAAAVVAVGRNRCWMVAQKDWCALAAATTVTANQVKNPFIWSLWLPSICLSHFLPFSLLSHSLWCLVSFTLWLAVAVNVA